MDDYVKLYRELESGIVRVKFIKKDGTVRDMLCSRDMTIIDVLHPGVYRKLGSHASRCNKKTGAIAVIDLILGECRAFSVNRIIENENYGEAETEEDIMKLYDKYVNREKVGEEESLTIDMLD